MSDTVEEQKERAERAQWEADLKATMDLPAGRRALAKIIRASAPMTRAFNESSVRATDFNLGRRDMGQWLANQCRAASPNLFREMDIF